MAPKNAQPTSIQRRPKQQQGRSRQARAPQNNKPGVLLPERSGRPRKTMQRKGSPSASTAYITKAAAQMVNPAGIVSPVVLPDTGSGSVCARKFQRTVTFSQASYPNLKIAMFPNLFMPGFIAGDSAAITIPAAAPGAVVATGELVTSVDDCSTGSFPMKLLDSAGNQIIGLAQPLADGAGTKKIGFSGSLSNPCAITVTVKNNSAESKVAAPVVSLWNATAAGNWTQIGMPELLAPVPRTSSVTASGTSGLAGITKFGIGVTGTNSRECKLDISISFSSAQVSLAAGKSFSPAFAEQIIDDKIESGRVTHLSMYARNTSAEAYTSGVITAARVPANFDIAAQGTSWTELATRLPENRYYTGPLKTGAYTFWIPQQLDEFTLDNVHKKVDSYRGADYLVLEAKDWAANSSVEVTFTWLVEFYTPNQNFEKIQTPPMFPEFQAVWHSLLRFPAAMCNPEHNKETGSFVKSVRDGLRSAYSFYKENSEIINTVGEALIMGLMAA